MLRNLSLRGYAFCLWAFLINASLSLAAGAHFEPSSSLINPATEDIVSSAINSKIPDAQPDDQTNPLKFRDYLELAHEIGKFGFDSVHFNRIVLYNQYLRKKLEADYEQFPGFIDENNYFIKKFNTLIQGPMPFTGLWQLALIDWSAALLDSVQFPILVEKYYSIHDRSIHKKFYHQALFILRITPNGCPSEQKGGPAICKLNPTYNHLMGLRARAEGYKTLYTKRYLNKPK